MFSQNAADADNAGGASGISGEGFSNLIGSDLPDPRLDAPDVASHVVEGCCDHAQSFTKPQSDL